MTREPTVPGPRAPELRSTAPRRYSRRISSIERGYLTAATQGEAPVVSLVVEGRGRIEPSALERAIAVTSRADPGLSVARRGKLWVDTGRPPRLTVGTVAPGEQWTGHPFLQEPLDLIHGPVAAVGLLRGPDLDRLVVRVSHAVADGRGIEHWTADLFRALRGEELVGSTSTVTERHFLEAARRRPAPGSPWSTPGAPGPSPLGGAGRGEGRRPQWVQTRLAGESTFLTARIMSVLGDLCPGGRVLVPVDLRRHDPGVISTANLSAPLYLEARPATPWKRNQGQILRAMVHGDELRALTAHFVTDNPMARSIEEARTAGRDGLFPCIAIVSDHGRLDLDEYAAPGWCPEAAFTLPMLVPYAAVFISSFTTGGRTSLTLTCRHGDDLDRARGLLEAIAEAVPVEPASAATAPDRSPGPGRSRHDG